MSNTYLDQDKYLSGVAKAESSNRYGALGPTGVGMKGPAMGKYQLTQTTLDALVDKYGHPDLEGLSGQQRYDAFLNNPNIQEEMTRTLVKDQQNTIRNLGGDPNDPVALGIAHRAGTGDKLRKYIAGDLDMGDKIRDGAGLNESMGEWLGKAGISPPAAAPAAQDPTQVTSMSQFGPQAMMMQPGGEGGPPGMGQPYNPYTNPMAGASMMGQAPPGIDFMQSPGLQMQGFQMPNFAGMPGAQGEAPGGYGNPALMPQGPWGGMPGGEIGMGDPPGGGGGGGGGMGPLQAPPQGAGPPPMDPILQRILAEQGGTQLPPNPPSEPLQSGTNPSPMPPLKRFGNAMLPGQPFNPDGVSMRTGLANSLTGGERGDGEIGRRERRIKKALAKATKLRAKGKDKRADRKERKADRLESGERVGGMRWLFGK
jgi:hypothetical protein